MVGAEPTGVPTAAPTLVVSTVPDNSTAAGGKSDVFEEIKSKFLNEIDKIPRERPASPTPQFTFLKFLWGHSDF